jgi:hypothetical protein
VYACRVGWGASQRVLRPQLLRLIESQIPELRAPHLNPRFNPVRHPPPPPLTYSPTVAAFEAPCLSAANPTEASLLRTTTNPRG